MRWLRWIDLGARLLILGGLVYSVNGVLGLVSVGAVSAIMILDWFTIGSLRATVWSSLNTTEKAVDLASRVVEARSV